jgi:hypothetical protein
MPLAVANKETLLALRSLRELDKRTGGALVEKAVARAKEDDVASIGEALANAIRVAYVPFVALAPPPTVALLNNFMAKVDWTYVIDNLLVRPELN